MRMRREHAYNLVVILLSVLVCLVIAEGLVLGGVVDYRLVFGTLGDEPWRNPLNRLDDELLHLHRPNQHLEGSYVGGEITRYHDIPRTLRYEYDIRYDARGFRNDRTRDSAHTVVIGDSFIESLVVPQEEILTAELERLRGLPVVNLGQLWYGPQQESVVLHRYGLPLEPSTVVWVFYGGNDLDDFRRYERARADWERLSAGFHSFPERSFTKNAARVLVRSLWPRKRTPPNPGTCALGSGERGTMYFFDLDRPLTDQDRRTLEQALAVIESAHDSTRAAGADFVFVYAPTKHEVYRPLCEFAEGTEVSRTTTPSGLGRILRDRLAERIPEAGLLDLTPALREAASEEPVFLIDDTHWSAAGNRAAAAALGAYLDSRVSRAR